MGIFMIKLNLPVLFAQKGIRVADADRLTDMGRSTLIGFTIMK